jgi:hypothetical protein
VNLIDHVDQGRDGPFPHDMICKLKAQPLGDQTASMAGKHVRMRLVQNICIRSLFAHAPEQLQIRGEAASSGSNGAVVLDLTGNEDMPTSAGGALENGGTAPIFSEARSNDQPTELSRAFENRFVEVAVLKQDLELAWTRGVEMRAKPVNRQR